MSTDHGDPDSYNDDDDDDDDRGDCRTPRGRRGLGLRSFVFFFFFLILKRTVRLNINMRFGFFLIFLSFFGIFFGLFFTGHFSLDVCHIVRTHYAHCAHVTCGRTRFPFFFVHFFFFVRDRARTVRHKGQGGNGFGFVRRVAAEQTKSNLNTNMSSSPGRVSEEAVRFSGDFRRSVV